MCLCVLVSCERGFLRASGARVHRFHGAWLLLRVFCAVRGWWKSEREIRGFVASVGRGFKIVGDVLRGR